ncbi:hypothetical protein Tsubulata_023273 [Turnera subulata]|uniref:Pentacotripeptide-repeat region of PRORP domain-containing protein n=1 Tax=Turnera subulata TaxID=218843 RepID=A0A9Q0FID0_9ROSI|nr:hypothetical protein Tsubulata_023273 [Turnera subulata]
MIISLLGQGLLHPQRLTMVFLNSIAYTKLVQFSAKTRSLIHGKLAHSHMIRTSFKPCLFLLNNLLNMYCKCTDLVTARHLFDRLPERTMISYNLLISGYSEMGFHEKAMGLFRMARKDRLKLDKFSYAGAVGVCARTGDFELGRVIHGMAIVSGMSWNVFLTNVFIDMYCKCGRVDQARLVFERSPELDTVSWNSLIGGYVRVGAYEEMLELLAKMHRCGLSLTTYTLGSVLKGCCAWVDSLLDCGKMLHGYTVKNGWDLDVVVATSVLDMYAKAGFLDDARRLFRMVPDQNVVMYNAMIDGCVQTEDISTECANEAFGLFSQMQRQGLEPSDFTFSSIIKICSNVEAFEYGKQVHAQICKRDFQADEFIGSALVELYSSMGSVDDGLKCFHSTSKIDIVLWTAMIAGHAHNGQFEKAMALFYELLASGRKPDEFIISTILGCCADLAAEQSGVQVHGYAIKSGIWNFTIVQTSLVCLYAKAGNLDSAKMIFEETQVPDVASWSVMICSNAQHGRVRDALDLLELMKGHEITPNHITFIGALTACSHGGLVEEGLEHFERMKKDYGITPNVKHYACVVDLLSRAGRLTDAEDFILNSCFKSNPVMWRSLLSACRVHGDTAIAKRVAERVIELEPEAASSYILLRNICNVTGTGHPATKIRELMEVRGVKKEPGLSWI